MIPMKSYTQVPSTDIYDSDEAEDYSTHDREPLQPVENVTKLRRNLGLLSSISIILGSVIGSGIFISPKGVLMHTGSVGLSMIVWLLCGLISLLGALSYIELGLSYPTSGGGYLYMYETVGELPAFLLLWISCLARISTSCVILSITFSNYLLYGIFTCVHPPDSAIRLISAVMICLVCYINMSSVKSAAGLQNLTVFGKLLALVIIIGTGLVHICLGNTQNLEPASLMNDTKSGPSQFAVAVYAGLFAYNGWDSLNILTEEVREPSRVLPRAVIISIPLITVIYILANIAYYSVLTTDQLLHSPAVAVSFAYGTLGPVAVVIPLLVAVSTLGGTNGVILCGSRTVLVAARMGHLPKTLAMLHKDNLTPVPSILMLGSIALIMLLGHDVYKLITYVGFLDTVSLVAPIIGMLVQRYRDPNRERPFRVWTIIPVLYILICLSLVALPWYVSPVEAGIGTVLCLSGIPVYIFTIHYHRKPFWFRQLSNKICRLVQKLTLSVSEEA